MTKLAAQIERMAASAEKLEQSYSAQVDVVQKLASVFGSVNTTDATAGVDAFVKTLSGLSDKMKDTGKTSEFTFQQLGKLVQKAGKEFSGKFPHSVAMAVGALKGFSQGVKNVLAMTKGVSSFIGSFVDGLANIAVSIIAIPFKMFEGLIDLAAKSGNGMNELAVAIEKLRKQFGALTGPTNKAIVSVSKELKGFKDTGLSAWRVFGTLAERLDYMRELATEMGGTFGQLSKEFEKNGGAILAYQKGLGISNEDMKGIGRNALAMGQDTTVALKEMTKQSYALGDAFGLDAKLISRDMSKAMTDVKHFGGATVKAIGEASTYARKLGLELKDITGTLDAFDTFDSAAENAAKLSQAFGTNIDAFKLMEEQDPAKQLDMLRKSFRDAGVDASNFNRAQLKLVSGTTGLDESTVKTALSMKNQGANMSEIQKKSGEAEKKTMTQAQAMGQLADAIERMVKSGGAQTGGFWDMFVKGFLGGIQQSKEFQTIIWNIKRALDETYRQGVRLGRAFVEMFPGMKDFLGGIGDFFQPAKFRTMVGGVVDIIEDFMNDLGSPTGPSSFPFFMEKLQKNFFDFFNTQTPAGSKMIGAFHTIFKILVKTVGEGIQWAAAKVADGIDTIVDLMSGKTLSQVSTAGGTGLGFMGKLLEPLIPALENSWKLIEPALNKLLNKLLSLAWNWVKAHKVLLAEIGVGIMGYIFAQSLLGAAMGGLASIIMKAAAGVLSQAVGGVLTKLGADVMGKMFSDAPTEGVSKSVSEYLKKSFSKASPAGVDVGQSIGSNAASTMNGKASDIGGKIGGSASTKMSAAGTAMSALAIAAIAYAAYQLGKQLIDSHFEAMDKADKSRRAADMSAHQASLYGNKDDVSSAIATQKAKIAKQEKENELEKYSLATRAAKAGIGLIGGVDLNAEKMRQLEMEKKTLADLEKKQADVLAGKKAYANQPMGAASQSAVDNKPKVATASDFMGATSLDEAKDKLASIEELSKKFNAKGFDLAGTIESIKKKFAAIDFKNLLTGEKAGEMGLAAEQMKKVEEFSIMTRQALGNFIEIPKVLATMATGASVDADKIIRTVTASTDAVAQIATRITDASTAVNFNGWTAGLTRFVETIKGKGSSGGITGALDAAGEMVKQANALNDALSSSFNKIDIKTKLENVAKGVGLGSKGSYTVNPSKEVQVTINLHVTMDADKVERVIIERSQSIIRDRINFATNNPTEKGNSQISDTQGATPKEIKSSGTK